MYAMLRANATVLGVYFAAIRATPLVRIESFPFGSFDPRLRV